MHMAHSNPLPRFSSQLHAHDIQRTPWRILKALIEQLLLMLIPILDQARYVWAVVVAVLQHGLPLAESQEAEVMLLFGGVILVPQAIQDTAATTSIVVYYTRVRGYW